MIIDGTGQKNLDNLGITDRDALRREVGEVVATTPAIDMHTHLYPPGFGSMSLSGIDELLTYHYLVAEVFRYTDVSPESFWRLGKQAQADLIWRTLFVENSPVSEILRDKGIAYPLVQSQIAKLYADGQSTENSPETEGK